MAKLISLQQISLKNHPEIKEETIQKYIFDNPSVLGLGDLTPVQRERIQPAGGRLDMLLASADNESRYEVEIQLGATDPSHIIRTIEYWDTERKRYPQYDHCAVIVAEEITGRFMNVISLFNGSIPLIALQLTAHKVGDDISLSFTKVISRVEIGTDAEDEYEVTDRNYWENRSSVKMLKQVDSVFADLSDYVEGYEFKYNKFYIGIAKDNVTKNFIYFQPKKSFFYLFCKGKEDLDFLSEMESAGLDVTYQGKDSRYRIKFADYNEYKAHEELVKKCVMLSRDYYNMND